MKRRVKSPLEVEFTIYLLKVQNILNQGREADRSGQGGPGFGSMKSSVYLTKTQ